MAPEVVSFVERAPEGGSRAQALGYPILAKADNWDGLGQAIGDALHRHFAEDELPELVRLDKGDLFWGEGESDP